MVQQQALRDFTQAMTAFFDPANLAGRPSWRKVGIMASGWGLLIRRLEDKAPGRVEKISPVFTSQRCSACGHVDREPQLLASLTGCE
jgi:transposase